MREMMVASRRSRACSRHMNAAIAAAMARLELHVSGTIGTSSATSLAYTASMPSAYCGVGAGNRQRPMVGVISSCVLPHQGTLPVGLRHG
jgi:hypothetical protein